ncbi:MAG: hypothetical protein A2X13_04385 [Bacteroidetes bacterium GWC2_33_15]|nr:MAG: hypothetical protein A2X10_06230 [Bacteroidetes bacterium GWA2_33_15]OFX49769.1 MAG: hypothetical protein A2X13_04385 [Bacteroidetes bacterium GWC2_33_15]OFX64960.1 MAG: hypothetical protein A2X15_06305 [Bacteroidetes bacterium GWB2_32_14]OFX69078.1 MAG: hypothetical protein A2X14_13850 [Bacteroidetes bacterium GWD2_33_33]HAN18348.1 hypothetical protein [Bacteroidales bacterium]
MKIKLKINQKIQLFIISSSIIIYIIAIGYISLNARKMAYADAIEVTNQIVQKSANEIKASLDADLSMVNTLATAFVTYKEMPIDKWQSLVTKMYGSIFKNAPHIYSIWDSWELNAVDPNYNKPTGRFVIIYWREKEIIKNNFEYRSLEGDPVLYAEIKKRTTPSIWEPYEDVFTDNKAEKFLMTTINAPIMDGSKYVGIVAVDITLDRFQKMVEKIKPYNGSYAFLVSNGGIITGHSDKSLLNKKIADLFPREDGKFSITEKIKEGKSFNFITNDVTGMEHYISFAPINVVNTDTPWSIAISVPVKTIMYKATRNFRISLIVGFIGLLILVLVINIISRNITNPITNITHLLKLISKGHIDKKMVVTVNSHDEIEEMANGLNLSIEGLNKKVEFANQIGAGELNTNFELLSPEDVLGQSLLEMRNSLLKARNEEEKRKTEDEKRRWTNEGLAKFAEILRQNNNDLNILANEIIKNLIYYIKANQGGLFIKNDQDKGNVVLELLAAFAYDRKKHLKKQIKIGEGLVGTCAVEKETIYITEIPQNYVQITSGLGGSNPNSLLLIPLLIENEIMGVIEIASFNKFEEHEIQFIEKVAESIASTLKSVRINIRTSQLLEQSQQQSEEMAAQEEEMRQNMEELQATQEESARREAEFKGVLEAVDRFLLKAEFSFNSDILYANSLFSQKLGYSVSEITGLKAESFFAENDKNKLQETWNNVMAGNTHQEYSKLKTKTGKMLNCIISFIPVYIDDEIEKILLLAIDTSEHK